MEKELEKLAMHYDDLEQPFSSASIWKKIVALNPSAFNLINYARQLRLSCNFSSAEKIINQIKVDEIPKGKRYLYYFNKGLIYQDQGRIKKAIKYYKKSIKKGTDKVYPYIFLSSLLSQRSQLNEVKILLLEALNKNSDLDDVYYNLSTNSARLGNFQEAIIQMKECLKIDEDYPNAKEFLNDFKNMNNQFPKRSSDTI